MPWYGGKAEIRRYLQEVNKTEKASLLLDTPRCQSRADTCERKKAIEYCLFQPGLFAEYLLHPHITKKHFRPFGTHFDFANRRAIIRSGGQDDVLTLTTINDFSNVVSRAIEYQGVWPVVGGIRGTDLTVGEIIALGERLRGKFKVEELQTEVLQTGHAESSWKPLVTHASISPEMAEAFADMFTAGLLLSFGAGEWKVTVEWNKLLDDYEFENAEQFLTHFWQSHKD